MSLLLALLTGEGLPPAPPAGVGHVVRGVLSQSHPDDETPDGEEETWTCPTCNAAKGADGYYWSRQGNGALRRHSNCKICYRARVARNSSRLSRQDSIDQRAAAAATEQRTSP